MPDRIQLLRKLVSGFHASVAKNVDPFRFPGKRRPDRIGVRTSARALLAMLRTAGPALSDPASSRLLLDLCAFRILGGRHYRLPRNDAFFWQCVESVQRDALVERGVSRAGDYELDLYRLPGASGTIELEAHPMNILNSFFIREYRFDRSGVVVDAGEHDVVIDGGGCWGDTALYFADRAPTGKVFVFEFEAHNLEVLRRNLARNPRLAERIEVVEKALWSKSGEELRFSDAGPATKIGAGSIAAESISIDDFASQAGRIDFIKLDVEGAEIPVLHGARNTIRTFAPKLAVSIYHSIDDLLTIPQLLQQLDYDVYIEHATIHAEETIAFGVARR
ncbi:MAG: hypothetical protein DMF56_19915 [Acidobacteria bacterium]|nr:MAG: hypothetical protein DMF56_19915 [Acidobacteriota bacterium]